MTVDELLAREAIRHTLASYNVYGDRLKVAELVALFTEDAVLDLETGTGGRRLEGREAIAGFFSGMAKPPRKDGAPGAESKPAPPEKPTEQKAPPFVRHHISTCHIHMTGPDEAEVRTYFAVYTQAGPDHCGYYVDRFKRTGDAWLIAQRQPRVDWTSPDSFFRRRG